MSTTYAIKNGRTVFDATTYTGTGAIQSINNTDSGTSGFKPDLVWVKSRSAATDNKLTDSVRGATNALISNTTGAETVDTNGVTAFNTNGFTLGTDTNYNNNTATYVAWQWQAGQGTTSSNTSGTVTSTTSVNATAGFSIVSYTNQVSTPFTVGHGLGVVPAFIIVKIRTTAGTNWNVYHQSLGATKYVLLNTADAAVTSSTRWNDTAPTSAVFTLGASSSATSTAIAYCWAEVAGFSKFGSYTGNGVTDGPFIYTGFRPKFVLIKDITDVSTAWRILDTSRDTYNAEQNELYPSGANAESNANGAILDGLSNGFKIRTTQVSVNTSGSTMIYAAFAECPFKYANAR